MVVEVWTVTVGVNWWCKGLDLADVAMDSDGGLVRWILQWTEMVVWITRGGVCWQLLLMGARRPAFLFPLSSSLIGYGFGKFSIEWCLVMDTGA